jgi:membrane-bound serine protease (ClpP class)
VIGAIALVLTLLSMQLLPINVTGLVLLALAFALFILEAKFTSHGILGAGGVVAMLLGALMLIRSPMTGDGVSLGAALGATLPFALITIALMRLVLRSRRWAPQTGVEQLVRETGEVRQPIAGGLSDEARGLVFIRGELWRAASMHPIPPGARVQVTRIDGLTLWVEPL